MTRMKRSQLKALIKECLVEILSEDVLIQRAMVGTVSEARRALPAPRRQPQPPAGLINPLDDGQMVLRQEALMQRNQLMRQSNTMNRQQQQVQGNDMAHLAGLDEGHTTYGPGGRQNRSDTGVMNPSDYLRLAQERPSRYNPMLDAPANGVSKQQHVQRQQYVQQPQPAAYAPPRDNGHDIPEFSTDALRMVFDDPSTHHTLREQASKGHIYNGRVDDALNGGGASAVAGDRFDMAVAQHQPDELFPDSAGRWANLAF